MNFDSSFPREDLGGGPKRRPKLTLVALAVFVLIATAGGYGYWKHASQRSDANVYIFKDLTGPAGATVLAHRPPTPWQRYAGGAPSRVAILLTDTHSSWLGLAHGFKSLGIPFSITTDYREAVRHHLVLVYPQVSGHVISREALRAFRAAMVAGATVVGFNVLDRDSQRIFGIGGAVASRAHRTISFDSHQAAGAEFRQTEERAIPFATKRDPTTNIGSYSYRSTGSTVATFEDGSAAVTRQFVGRGSAYAFGLDAGSIMLKGFNNREEHVARSYVNTYEPTIDVLLRYFRNLYRAAQPDAVLLQTAPFNNPTSVLIGHDVDASVSMANCPAYAAFERREGIRTTYFIQTNYIHDYNDAAFFNQRGAEITQQLEQAGMEVASHSVSHSRNFAHFPLGSGNENYPQYRPFMLDPHLTMNGTIFGELRVSKFLLEHFAGVPVVSFRPGDLSDPYMLPNVLEATGYRYSSAVTANNSLTHLPFQLNEDRATLTESSIYEFPITVEDEAAPRLDKREPDAERLEEQVARDSGIFAILIHPNVLGYKLDFERRFIKHFKGKVWFATYAQFGDWWRARDAVQLDLSSAGNLQRLHINAPLPIDGLTLALAPDTQVESSIPAGAVRSQSGTHLVLARISGVVTLTLSKRRNPLAAALPNRSSF